MNMFKLFCFPFSNAVGFTMLKDDSFTNKKRTSPPPLANLYIANLLTLIDVVRTEYVMHNDAYMYAHLVCKTVTTNTCLLGLYNCNYISMLTCSLGLYSCNHAYILTWSVQL